MYVIFGWHYSLGTPDTNLSGRRTRIALMFRRSTFMPPGPINGINVMNLRKMLDQREWANAVGTEMFEKQQKKTHGCLVRWFWFGCRTESFTRSRQFFVCVARGYTRNGFSRAYPSTIGSYLGMFALSNLIFSICLLSTGGVGRV